MDHRINRYANLRIQIVSQVPDFPMCELVVSTISILPFSKLTRCNGFDKYRAEVTSDHSYKIVGIRLLSNPGELDILKMSIVKDGDTDDRIENPWLDGPIDDSIFSINVAGSWVGGACDLRGEA